MRCRKCKEKKQFDAQALPKAIQEILLRVEIDDFFQTHENCAIKILPPTPRPLLIKKMRGRVVIIEDDTSELIFTDREPVGPHAEFEILEDGTWDLAFFREAYKRKGKKTIEYIDDCRVVRPIRQRRQQKIAAEWSQNLLIRQYAAGTLRYARKF